MPFITYPLDNIEYSADDAALFHCPISSGIYAGSDTTGDFAITIPGNSNQVTIAPGLAWLRLGHFRGVCTACKTPTVLELGLPDSTRPRIDHIMLQFDANANSVEIKVKQGTPNSSPIAPNRVTTEALYELHLYEVTRTPSVNTVTAADVRDLRMDSNWCGLMADFNKDLKIDTTPIYNQIQGLLDNINELLSGDGNVAGNIQKRIDDSNQTAKATITKANWSAAAPYTQTVSVSMIEATDFPHVTFVPDSTLETAIAQQEAWSCVSSAKAEAGGIKFTCFEDKPEVDIQIQIEINR